MDDIVIAICIFITGMAVGMVCIRAIQVGGPNRSMTGIITTTSKGDLCGLPGAVETDGLGKIKKPVEINKEKFMAVYCGSCPNIHFCFPEMFEPNTNPAIVHDLPSVRRCKMEFDRVLKVDDIMDE